MQRRCGKPTDVESALKSMMKSNRTPAGSPKNGSSTDRILDATERVICKVGYSRLNLRSVALEAGLSLGTVSYVFKTKEDLIRAFADRLLEWYTREFAELEAQTENDHRAFLAVVRFLISDLRTERTSRLFPELWALANHNPYVQQVLDSVYEIERQWLERLLRKGWPQLTGARVRLIVGTLIPLIEGHTIFIPAHRTQPYPQLVAEKAILEWIHALLGEDDEAPRPRRMKEKRSPTILSR